MNECSRHEEDLALLAGGDLGPQARADEALDHVASCAACAALLAELQADLEVVRAVAARAQAQDPGAADLAGAVLRQVAPERTGSLVSARTGGRGAERLALAPMGAVAAGLLLVASATWLVLTHDSGGSEERASAFVTGAAAPQAATVARTNPVAEDRPVRVRRTAGDHVELTWDGDGREARGVSPVRTYTVLASANPRDFSAAQPVEVAGNHLVATMALPAHRTGDRTVTFFRVQ